MPAVAIAMINSPQEDSSLGVEERHSLAAEAGNNPGLGAAAGHSTHHRRTGCLGDHRNAT